MKSRFWYGLSALWLAVAAIYLVCRIVYGFRAGGPIPVIVGLLVGVTVVAVLEYRARRAPKTPQS